MKRRTILASMGAATAGGSLVIGSGGFSSARVNRDTMVEVVGDDEAFLRIQYADVVEDVDSGIRKVSLCKGELFTLENQFQTPIDVEITETGNVLSIEDSPENLAVGEGKAVAVSCAGSGESSLSIKITNDAGMIKADMVRTFDVSCELVQGVEFTGCGNPKLLGCDGPPNLNQVSLFVFSQSDDRVREINAEIRGQGTIAPDPISDPDNSSNDNGPPSNGQKIGVWIPAQNGVSEELFFYNPNFDFENKNCGGGPSNGRTEAKPGDPRDQFRTSF